MLGWLLLLFGKRTPYTPGGFVSGTLGIAPRVSGTLSIVPKVTGTPAASLVVSGTLSQES